MKDSPLLGRLAALSDPIRARLLAALDRHELTVGELRKALQLPQSTVSRHLRALADAGWIASREAGTSNWYRLALPDGDAGTRKLWLAVRDELHGWTAVRRDAERVRGVVAARHTTSQKFFASRAGQWDRLRDELFGARAELEVLLGVADPAWTVADLGCGTGQLTAAVAPFVRRVVAVDESAAMLRAAKARVGDRPNVEFRHGSLEALPLGPAEADVTFLSLVLHYIAEPAELLARVRRALGRGGRLVILDMLRHDRAEITEAMGHAWPGFDAKQISDWAATAGFASSIVTPLAPKADANGPDLFVARLMA